MPLAEVPRYPMSFAVECLHVLCHVAGVEVLAMVLPPFTYKYDKETKRKIQSA